MRTTVLLIALALAAVIADTSPGEARTFPWCAHYGRGLGGTNCGFVSHQQCMAAVSGNGGFCNRNPAYHRNRRR
jgi:hypothetical protein